MESILTVKDLAKSYPGFRLSGVSFSLQKGSIMGFIGRNGAGKTTTLKSILNLVHPEAGKIQYFGLDLREHEREIKQRIGFAGASASYYQKKKISDIMAVTKAFYRNWDEAAYKKYLKLFSLDEAKTPSQLSAGMAVKLNLISALSHRAELLVLDEPTSGLDPVSRAELLEVFRYLKGQGISILFSTHITSDLEKCADWITYIREGRIVASEKTEDFLSRCKEKGIGNNLDEIMIHCEREAFREKLA